MWVAMIRNFPTDRRIMEVNIMKKHFIIPTALFLMIGILLVPLASAATYYISSVPFLWNIWSRHCF